MITGLFNRPINEANLKGVLINEGAEIDYCLIFSNDIFNRLVKLNEKNKTLKLIDIYNESFSEKNENNFIRDMIYEDCNEYSYKKVKDHFWNNDDDHDMEYDFFYGFPEYELEGENIDINGPSLIVEKHIDRVSIRRWVIKYDLDRLNNRR